MIYIYSFSIIIFIEYPFFIKTILNDWNVFNKLISFLLKQYGWVECINLIDNEISFIDVYTQCSRDTLILFIIVNKFPECCLRLSWSRSLIHSFLSYPISRFDLYLILMIITNINKRSNKINLINRFVSLSLTFKRECLVIVAMLFLSFSNVSRDILNDNYDDDCFSWKLSWDLNGE